MARRIADRKVLELEFPAGTDADARQLIADRLFLGVGWSELKGEVQIVEVTRLRHLLVDLREVYARRGGRGGLLEVCGKGLHLVASLHLDRPIRNPHRVELNVRKRGGAAVHRREATDCTRL